MSGIFYFRHVRKTLREPPLLPESPGQFSFLFLPDGFCGLPAYQETKTHPFTFYPAAHTHAQKTDSARKRAKRKTAVAGGGLQRRKLGYPGFYCQGGEGCISSVREDWRLGKLPCFFLCRGTAPGRGGPPWQAAVRRRFRSWLLGWGVFHEEEGGVCPLSVSIKQ